MKSGAPAIALGPEFWQAKPMWLPPLSLVQVTFPPPAGSRWPSNTSARLRLEPGTTSQDRPKVQIPACIAIRKDYNKKAEKAADDLQSGRIDKEAYEKLGELGQMGEDAYKRCFAEHAPQQPSFAEATKQAQALLARAMGN